MINSTIAPFRRGDKCSLGKKAAWNPIISSFYTFLWSRKNKDNGPTKKQPNLGNSTEVNSDLILKWNSSAPYKTDHVLYFGLVGNRIKKLIFANGRLKRKRTRICFGDIWEFSDDIRERLLCEKGNLANEKSCREVMSQIVNPDMKICPNLIVRGMWPMGR